MRIARGAALMFLAGAANVILCGGMLFSQHAEKIVMQTTTQERLETEPWWPTKSTVPLQDFAGSDACSKCHQDFARDSSAMRQAAVAGGRATFLKGKTPLAFRSGNLAYSLKSSAEGIAYSVSSGRQSVTRNLDWVMGAGNLGRTFLYQADGHWFQSQVTLYSEGAALDTTTGFSKISASTVSAALGQMLSPDDIRRCFGCHTVHAVTPAGFNPLHAEAGLGCEACHGPGREHASSMAAAKPLSDQSSDAKLLSRAIFNPAALSPADSIDFCGSCHRTSVDAIVALQQTSGNAGVRFQPYRLQQSKCWRSTQDARLTCVACHNPHEPLNRDTASYDAQCIQCHSGAKEVVSSEPSAAICPKATSQCVSCHMPKVRVESMHGDFTDHRIRIAKAGEPYPN